MPVQALIGIPRCRERITARSVHHVGDDGEHAAHHGRDGAARPDRVQLDRALGVGVEPAVAAAPGEVLEHHAVDPERCRRGGCDGEAPLGGDEQDRGQHLVHALLDPRVRVREEAHQQLVEVAGLLGVVPDVLNPGGTAAVISFHSGEDRLVKAAFRDGLRAGTYEAVSPEAIRPTLDERKANPRSRSAKLRWARKSVSG